MSKTAKAIMIQGTMSNVGKSLIVGALCRIFKQDGYSVAPFKSQNMALNSFITAEGLEMGRAQVMQAEAAGILPSVKMNPILLKPTNDIGSQVIVNGRPIGNMSAKEYYGRKTELIPDIMSAYKALSENFDIIVIEGAGSPAEINLRDNDIVNMGMAKMANAPVLLVGDIDRGGVFAQLLGTIDLLEDDERALVKGMLINKFRGDRSILKSGLDMLEARAGKPILGVVPYIYCDIDDEDSLSERFSRRSNTAFVDIAVIKLPRISNFTDFNSLDRVVGAGVRYVKNAYELGNPDMIIIPGTKSTVSDMLWMRQNGLEAKIKQQAAAGKIIFGICGGYQILGKKITDNDGAEQKGSFDGMGLLPIVTDFKAQKQRTQINGSFKNAGGILSVLNGSDFIGYEIHMGQSKIIDGSLPMTEANGFADGASQGNIYGTYVHGIFDSQDIAAKTVSAIMRSKGIDSSNVKALDITAYKEQQYDMLADSVRNSVDMCKIYNILNGTE